MSPLKQEQEKVKVEQAMLEEIKTQTTLGITNTFSWQQMTTAVNELATIEQDRVKWQKCAMVSARYVSSSKIVKKYCGFLDDELAELNELNKVKVTPKKK